MSLGRPAIVAAQAVVVGVLVVVVYLTLLKPEAEDPLSGIEAPGGARVTQAPSDSSEGNEARGRDRGDGRRAGGEGRSSGPPAAAAPDLPPATAIGAVPVVPPVGAPGSEPGGPGSEPGGPGSEPGGPGGPTDDQYLNAVARLTVELY